MGQRDVMHVKHLVAGVAFSSGGHLHGALFAVMVAFARQTDVLTLQVATFDAVEAIRNALKDMFCDGRMTMTGQFLRWWLRNAQMVHMM